MAHGKGSAERSVAHPGPRNPVGPIPDEPVGRYKYVNLEETGETVVYCRENEQAWVQSSFAIDLDHMR